MEVSNWLSEIPFSAEYFRDLAKTLYDFEELGGAHIPGALSAEGRAEILEEIAKNAGNLKRAQTDVGSVKQDLSSFYCGSADNNRAIGAFPKINNLKETYLVWERKLAEVAGFNAGINSIGVHRYYANSGGISPHQDYASDMNIISIFVLEGNSPLYLCRDREKTDSLPIHGAPGDIILLRGPRNSGEKEQRPFHYVGEVKEQRTTIIFRQRLFGRKN